MHETPNLMEAGAMPPSSWCNWKVCLFNRMKAFPRFQKFAIHSICIYNSVPLTHCSIHARTPSGWLNSRIVPIPVYVGTSLYICVDNKLPFTNEAQHSEKWTIAIKQSDYDTLKSHSCLHVVFQKYPALWHFYLKDTLWLLFTTLESSTWDHYDTIRIAWSSTGTVVGVSVIEMVTNVLMSRWIARVVWPLGLRNDFCYRAVVHPVSRNGIQLRSSGIFHSRFLRNLEKVKLQVRGSYCDIENGAISVPCEP